MRYSKLEDLRKSLTKQFGAAALAQFPPKMVMSLTVGEINTRREMLQAWLQNIARQPNVTKSVAFQEFLTCARNETVDSLPAVSVANNGTSESNGTASYPAPQVTLLTPDGKSISVPVTNYDGAVYDPVAGKILDSGGIITGYDLPSNQDEAGLLFIKLNRHRHKHPTVPRKITAFNMLSGSKLDFRDARFVYPETVITAVSVLGGCKILLPRGVRVVCNGVGILGGHGKGAEDTGFVGATVGPTIYLKGLSLLGGCEVKVDMKTQPVVALSTAPPLGGITNATTST